MIARNARRWREEQAAGGDRKESARQRAKRGPMGRPSRGAALRAVDPNVMEFVEAAAIGDVRMVKKLVKAAKVEIDDGKREDTVVCNNVQQKRVSFFFFCVCFPAYYLAKLMESSVLLGNASGAAVSVL